MITKAAINPVELHKKCKNYEYKTSPARIRPNSLTHAFFPFT